MKLFDLREWSFVDPKSASGVLTLPKKLTLSECLLKVKSPLPSGLHRQDPPSNCIAESLLQTITFCQDANAFGALPNIIASKQQTSLASGMYTS